ncbi:MAG: DASS family sodium-coupled anion symporter [Candidatus Binatia bacterium]
MTQDVQSSNTTGRQWLGLLGGVGAFAVLLLLPPPEGMSLAAWRTAAVAALMGVWWITEAVDLTVTAFVPLFLFPVLDILPASAVSSAYAGQIVFLFFGAFFLALATERWGLHRRVALWIVSRIGGSPRLLLLGFFGTTALLSMWMSNTASTVVMLPIALAILTHIEAQGYDTNSGFGTALILGMAYSASIGGVSTPVGTPPNAVFLGAFENLFPDAPNIGFLYWMLFGVPTAVVMLVCLWIYLVYIVFRLPTTGWQEDQTFLAQQIQDLGPMSRPERRVLLLFAITALLWMFRTDLPLGPITIPGWVNLFPAPANIKDSTVAMFMATLLFVIPTGEGKGSCLLDRTIFERMPWGILVLLGGSLALAQGVGSSGLARWIGTQLDFLQNLSPLSAIVAVCSLLVGLTEFTSNTATTTLMMPVLAATATGMKIDPLLLMIPATFAASFAFMLPTATAPNAIVFASRRVTLPQMFWIGLGLNIVGVLVLPILLYLIGVPVFGISVSEQPSWVP